MNKHHFSRLFLAMMAAVWGLVSTAQAQGLLRDAEIEQFLKDYSYPLFEAAGLPPENVDIHIIGDNSLNAFVSSGLNVFVFTGLISAADTPNQIEGVLAHETGHISGGHLARSDEAIKAATRPIILSLVLGAAAIAAGSTDAGLAALALGQTIGQANYLSYSRGQESKADQAGLSFLEEVGHSGQGLVEFFSKLRNQQLITANTVNQYYQTHPLANARISALQTRVTQSVHKDVKDSPEEIMRLKMIQAKIHGFLHHTHATLRRFPLSDQSAPAQYARAVAYYRSSNLNEATKSIDRLLEEQPENPYFWELKGQMLFEHGKVREAIEPHRKSTEYGPEYALLKINLARALNATDDQEHVDEAIKVLKTALHMERDNTFGWSELARAYGTKGEKSLAEYATAESYYHSGPRGAQSAGQFATRALRGLEKGTPEWQQANDIIFAARNSQNRNR